MGQSATQPWATLVVLGFKRIETRSWSTAYRGELGIHAAKGLGPVGGAEGLRNLCYHNRAIFDALMAAGYYEFNHSSCLKPLPLGALLGQVNLLDCVETWPSWASVEPWFTGEHQGRAWHVPPPEPEQSFGDYRPGRFAWLLDEHCAFAEPIPCKGQLGLWEYGGEIPRNAQMS